MDEIRVRRQFRLTEEEAAEARLLNSTIVTVGEDGTGQDRDCPTCGAGPFQACIAIDETDGECVELGQQVHAARRDAA